MEEMTIKKIRDKFERTEENPLGINTRAIDKLIEMLKLHENSESEQIRTITKMMPKLGDVAPNYTIFESDKDTFFMRTFCALQINPNYEENYVISHEFGHSVLGAVNKTEVPDNFKKIVQNAKANCLSPENKQMFLDYIEYLCDPDNEKRTVAEKTVLSDILSSIFQYPSLTIKAKENRKFIFPSFHQRDYYFDEEKNEMNLTNIFDEDFANFYALNALNCARELDILRMFLGDEWMSVMESELEKAATRLKEFGEIDTEKVM